MERKHSRDFNKSSKALTGYRSAYYDRGDIFRDFTRDTTTEDWRITGDKRFNKSVSYETKNMIAGSVVNTIRNALQS